MPGKEYNSQDTLAITLTMEQWQTVQLSLREHAGAAKVSMVWWQDFCQDKRMAAETAARYEQYANNAEEIRAVIEAAILELYGQE